MVWNWLKKCFGARPVSESSESTPIKLGTPSASLDTFRTDVVDLGDRLELDGSWIDPIWSRSEKITIMKAVDVNAFLSQRTLPYVFPNNADYCRSVAESGDPQENLRSSWTRIFLHHPDPEIVIRTILATEKIMTYWGAQDLAYLVTYGNPGIEDVAIRSFWRLMDERCMEWFLNVLGSSGTIPSNINQERAKVVIKRICATCPSDYPATIKKKFEEMIVERFGPSILGTATRQDGASAGRVRYEGTRHDKVDLLGQTVTNTYEDYVADSKADALSFLEAKTVTKEGFCIVVETPEGRWCKDNAGMFQA